MRAGFVFLAMSSVMAVAYVQEARVRESKDRVIDRLKRQVVAIYEDVLQLERDLEMSNEECNRVTLKYNQLLEATADLPTSHLKESSDGANDSDFDTTLHGEGGTGGPENNP